MITADHDAPNKRFTPSHTKTAALLLALLGITVAAHSGTVSQKLAVASKWERHEITFTSDVAYLNAIQQTELDAYFVSPEGVTNRVPGFWDGERTWRVRFAPDELGVWKYFTRCSDADNAGLHDQSGEFLCTAATGRTRFGQHGPVRVSRTRRHLEHTTREPFLWLGDVALEGARISDPEHWSYYARIRSAQSFNAVLWSVAPGKDDQGETAYTGDVLITLNLDFFHRLDEKVATLNRAGMLNAIAPLWEIGDSPANPLPADQVERLLRYVVARWGADDVAWVLAFESESDGKRLARWREAGRNVFAKIKHAPVILFPGEATWALDEFRQESWVDAFGFNTTQALDETALPWLQNGPLALERRKEPARPLITLLSPPEHIAPRQAVTAEQARRLAWWTLLINTPAGVTYQTRDIATWQTTRKPAPGASAPLPAWQHALILPGAYDIGALYHCLKGVDFWRLHPYPRALAEQPGDNAPQKFIAVAGSEERDVTVAYSPGNKSITISADALPPAAQATWIDPRSGKSSPAGVESVGDSFQFKSPDSGDWFLVLRQGRTRVAAR